MRMIDDILAVIDDITPKEFLWLYVGVWVVLLMMGYFLAGGFYVFMTAIMLIVSIGVIYKYQKPPIVENNSVFLMPVFGLLYTGIFHSGLLFAPELITDKSQTQTLTAIVPNEHEYVQGSGKGAKSYYYLNMDGTRLHCDDDQYDDCENIYAYKGQKATVYHYDGLAYEIDVGGQKVYEFYAQVNKFKATQHKKMTELVCAFILFGIPSVIFFFINKRVVRDIERVNANQDKPTHETYEDYKRNKQAQSTKRQHAKNIQSRIGAGGWAWRILFGCLAIFALLLLIFTLFGKYFISAGVFLLVMGGCYYLSQMPLKNAKAEVAEFEELSDAGELSDYPSVGIYNHMGVFSWIIMYVLCMCMMVTALLTLTYISTGEWLAFWVFFVVTVIMAGVVYFVIKRAINQRDEAFEW